MPCSHCGNVHTQAYISTFICTSNWLVAFCRGAGPSCTSGEVTDRLTALKREIAELDQLESSLDQQKKHIQQNLRNVSEDPLNHQYPFMNTDMSKWHNTHHTKALELIFFQWLVLYKCEKVNCSSAMRVRSLTWLNHYPHELPYPKHSNRHVSVILPNCSKTKY